MLKNRLSAKEMSKVGARDWKSAYSLSKLDERVEPFVNFGDVARVCRNAYRIIKIGEQQQKNVGNLVSWSHSIQLESSAGCMVGF